ncbi:MAG TPA: tannase/feruloyl esterase family alpha/beta hydrolase [Gammaproteobacteria bacterium]|nr:tannase/feruloyl esterase family alpha/beta hydrolase [Gammaproteobacteria bacterium]
MRSIANLVGALSVCAFAACGDGSRDVLTASSDEALCAALSELPNLTIISASLRPASATTPSHCYVRGHVARGIRYHVQLPLPQRWNGRFLQWGDGTKDGDLDFADHRLAQGYAVANSNMGHDSGAESGASFAFDNREAEIDFGYRAVHLTVNAAKTVIDAYYGRESAYSYFEGCSTGGREGLMEAQRFPDDFDGIVAGAPVIFYQELNAAHTWLLQRVFRNDFAGNLAFDADGDGSPESLRKLQVLGDAVLAQCDAYDGIQDRVIDEPLDCDFDPDVHLADKMCANDMNADDCFTAAQLQTVKDFYRGPYDSHGVSVIKGRAFGAEPAWIEYIPHSGNSLFPEHLYNARDHAAFLFYETDPGVPVPRANELSYRPNKNGTLREWAWWEFDIDDVTRGDADLMKAITNADDPNLERFLIGRGGKLILWHGWADAGAPPEPTVDYYDAVVTATFGADLAAARERARLFMFPGMGHCGGGPGPNEWDPLTPLVDWVERGIAPDSVIATHRTDGLADNERRVCAHPQRAVYTGSADERNDPNAWVAGNFSCR